MRLFLLVNKFDSVKNLEWLSHLSALNDLDLTDINLSKAVGWQQVVHKLPNLSQLVLSNCSLQDVLEPSVPMVNTSTSHAAPDVGAGNLNVSIFELLLKYRHSLVWLDLSVNHLQRPIPEAFGNMTSLEKLYLSGNRLKGGVPKSFGNLCRLGYLSLADNDLEGMLPELIGNLSGCLQSSLENFDMRGNKVMGRLPNLIAEFSSLWSLELSNNKLSGPLTKSIGRMSNLRHLHVGSNNFSEVITEEHFLNLSTLRSLNLSFNNLSINFSHDWNPPFQLDIIDLSSCLLGPEFPEWIKTQSEFSLLHLSHCGISGNIPEWFWNQSSRMEGIDLSSNNLSGTLPDLSEKFQGSPGIDLSSNKFEGPLPLFPANAIYIDLSNNTFSGSISSLCAIIGGELQFLDLSNNNLSGVLPDCFNWPMLVVLKLANNHFFGEIPSSVGSLSWLESVSLRNNSLFGEIPRSLGNCGYVQFVDLSHNMFSGMIPYWIGDMLPSIAYLLLRSNNFHGAIPSQLCQLKNILLLDFSNNSLSGSIPRCINQMSALAEKETSSVVVDHVIFTSADSRNFGYTGIYRDKTSLLWKGLEFEIPNLKDRRVIDFSNNNLSGSIPDLMWSLVGLVQLNLSRNQLSGRIPPDLGQMKELESLDLSINNLSGQLPPSMSQMYFLNTLNLSYNKFSGRIPFSTQMTTINETSFAGNPALCGLPLIKPCSGNENPKSKPSDNENKDSEEDQVVFWDEFLSVLPVGAAAGFVGVLALRLYHDHPWKHVISLLFNKLKVWLENIKDFLYLIIATLAFLVKDNASKLRRKFKSQKSPIVSP